MFFSRYYFICITLVILMIIIGFLGFNAYIRHGLPWRIDAYSVTKFSESIKWPVNNSNQCSNRFKINPCHQSTAMPSVLILGDSHANHLYPGLVEMAKDASFINIGICGSFLDVASRFTEHDFGNNVCQMNATIMENLRAIEILPSIKTVIISGLWNSSIDGEILTQKEKQYFGSLKHYSLRDDEKLLSNRELAWRGLSRTIELLLKANKTVIFARDVPPLSRDIRDLCISRFNRLNKVIANCMMDKNLSFKARFSEDWVVNNIQETFPSVLIYDPLENDEFCNSTQCYIVKNGLPLYRDQHHLSIIGSQIIGKNISQQLGMHLK